jgi:carboxypeptidase D
LYFDREDVKLAIHAPTTVEWKECADRRVFVGRDTSPPSALSVLPNVIEKSVRTVIIHGLADFRLIAEGSVQFLNVVATTLLNLVAFCSARIVIQK